MTPIISDPSDSLGARRQADQALAVPVEPEDRLDPSGFDPSRIAEIAEQLTPKQRAALRPCAQDRACLKKAGLVGWRKPNPRHRLPSLKLTGLGYAVRNYLGLTEPAPQEDAQ